MFISNTEKYQIQMTLRSLQATISDLSRENETMKQAIIELEQKAKSFKKPIGRPLKVKKEKKPIIRTPEAPYGYKLDGTPKKRPGKPLPTKPEVTNAESLPV